jgi:hypothetical protein
MEFGFGFGTEINMGKHSLILRSGYDFGFNEMCRFNGISEKTGTLTMISVAFRYNISKSN